LCVTAKWQSTTRRRPVQASAGSDSGSRTMTSLFHVTTRATFSSGWRHALPRSRLFLM